MIEYILDYLYSLLGVAQEGIVPAYEFGTYIKQLREVAEQEPQEVPAHCTPREGS